MQIELNQEVTTRNILKILSVLILFTFRWNTLHTTCRTFTHVFVISIFRGFGNIPIPLELLCFNLQPWKWQRNRLCICLQIEKKNHPPLEHKQFNKKPEYWNKGLKVDIVMKLKEFSAINEKGGSGQGSYNKSVTFESLIYLIRRELWKSTLCSTSSELKKY